MYSCGALAAMNTPVSVPLGLRVDEAVLPVHGRQQGGLGLHGVLVRDARGEVGREKLLGIGLGALEGVFERERQRRRPGRMRALRRRPPTEECAAWVEGSI